MAKVKKEKIADQPPATLGYEDKPLGSWPDEEKHDVAESVEEKDSETVMGHATESGSDEVADIEEIAKSVGLYDDKDPNKPEEGPENPDEVSIADQIEKDEKDRREE